MPRRKLSTYFCENPSWHPFSFELAVFATWLHFHPQRKRRGNVNLRPNFPSQRSQKEAWDGREESTAEKIRRQRPRRRRRSYSAKIQGRERSGRATRPRTVLFSTEEGNYPYLLAHCFYSYLFRKRGRTLDSHASSSLNFFLYFLARAPFCSILPCERFFRNFFCGLTLILFTLISSRKSQMK